MEKKKKLVLNFVFKLTAFVFLILFSLPVMSIAGDDLSLLAGIPMSGDLSQTTVYDSDTVFVEALLDDFNRTNGPIGSNWTNQTGTFVVDNNAARGGNYALATYNGVTSNVLEADVRTNGTGTQYIALVLGYSDLGNNLFCKVQQQNGTGKFDHAAFYFGNNIDGSFFALDSNFATAHMKIELVGTTVTMTFSNIDGGNAVQSYSYNYGTVPGAGVGMAGWNSTASLDNFSTGGANASCSLDVSPTFSNGTLSLNFNIEASEPTTFNTWLSFMDRTLPLWSIQLPSLNSPLPLSVPFPFPQLGTIGILTTLTTSGGIICSDWGTVDTGPVAADAEDVVEDLQNLF